MRSRHLFLLIYLTALRCYWGASDAQRNETCLTQELCTQAGDPTSNFLQCVGLPATDTGRDHLQNLKDTLDAALDVYSFMRSSLSQTPVFGLELGISVNPEAEAYQDEDLIKVWMEVKLKPLLSSISRGFLTCLSNKNFSCNTYQTMVEELSDHFSEMDPIRQRWIYMFFMYPFLSGERAGCVRPGENSEDWLIRNFGSFKAVARMRDFTALNMVFSGLEVLHLLTPEQKAELLLHPEVEGLENGTLSLVFHTLMTEVHSPMENSTWTTPGYPNPTYPPSYTPAYPPRPTSDNQYSPRPPSPQESLREVVNGFMGVFRPFGSLVREFVSLTHKAVLFFDTVALGIDNSDNMSSSVLQGFTCTRVASMTTTKIKKLVKACRRKGKNRVALRETQLTCMYNYIKEESNVTSYNLYPPDMLLYYDYSKVPRDTCKDYFSELGDADFSVFSDALSFKRTALVNNVKTCLGISGTVLSSDNLQVLGNMVCVLDGSYIQNSDQLILQKLQNCNDLTDEQVAAIETLLTSGKTQYGLPATWTRETLDNLGVLPLYLTSSFYKNFSKKVKGQFLQSFLKVLRKNGTSRQKKRRMKTAIRQSIIDQSQSKRSIVSECTVGNITQVTISENTFPFNYETVTKFNCCLTAKTVVDNLDAITANVDELEYLEVVLARLREAYSANSTIPEAKVQVLGPASRVATNADITMWNITKIDTLSALMDSSNGNWDAAMAQAIISKYLRNSGNTLGSAELNSIGGPNLCSLDISLLKTITQSSLSKANALTVTNCNIMKKRTLFIIAEGAFQSRSTISATSYQLTQPYIGGADSAYVQRLSTSNISMDMDTFISLDPTVIQTLGVSQVKGLLGSNLPELKSYENQSMVRTWISTRFQADLDYLGLGLKGGKADPSTVGVGTIFLPTSAGVTGGAGPVNTVAGGAAATTTASGGAINRPTFGLHLLLATLAVAVLYILH